MLSEATMSPCTRYRYRLLRRWNDSPLACWVMLNPSTADASINDPTINRCISFAKVWGMGGIAVLNLFAFRATDPKQLKGIDDPIGPENDEWIIKVATEVMGPDADWKTARNPGKIVYAWGKHGSYLHRDAEVRKFLDRYAPVCIGRNKDGSPKHPLYTAASTPPSPFVEG